MQVWGKHFGQVSAPTQGGNNFGRCPESRKKHVCVLSLPEHRGKHGWPWSYILPPMNPAIPVGLGSFLVSWWSWCFLGCRGRGRLVVVVVVVFLVLCYCWFLLRWHTTQSLGKDYKLNPLNPEPP